MAAGYKALTVCSAVHTAQEAGTSRTPASVEANELVGIYPELQSLIADMKAEMAGDIVSVAWDAVAPPRIATYRPGRGCVIEPMGYVVGSAPARAPQVRRTSASPLATAPAQGDAAALTGAVDRAFRQGFGVGTNTTGVVVLQNGRIVAERYAPDFGPLVPQRTWSVAKSLAGTLIGAAVQRGEVDVKAPAAIANWRGPGDPRGAITLEALMRMSSGLTSDTAGNRTDALYFGGTAADEQAPGWPLLAPVGSTYRYANNDTLLAVMAAASDRMSPALSPPISTLFFTALPASLMASPIGLPSLEILGRTKKIMSRDAIPSTISASKPALLFFILESPGISSFSHELRLLASYLAPDKRRDGKRPYLQGISQIFLTCRIPHSSFPS